jgi:hypothetical protein
MNKCSRAQYYNHRKQFILSSQDRFNSTGLKTCLRIQTYEIVGQKPVAERSPFSELQVYSVNPVKK